MTESGVRKRLTGVVVSNKMDKTAVVQIEVMKKHDTYSKYIKSNKKYQAHDPQNICQIGDKVKIIETRPLSKMKRWQVLEIIEKAISGDIENHGIDAEGLGQ
jgi:small subunit ribosomal protein S17